MKNVHFIAIGGAAMHNLAMALNDMGIKVTGSDDEINDPSYSRLKAKGLLPEKNGWFPEKIHSNLDAVILGMHARKDNPELLKALESGIKVYSYPEFIFQATQNKTRIVIGGSHGKTSITGMVLHVFKSLQIECDFLVGAQLEGFENMVKITENAKFAVIEGDEYLTSPIDPRPKFHLYKPHIAVLSGIAWDHINVFPTWEIYVDQFRIFIDTIEPEGKLFYFEGDETLNKLCKKSNVYSQAYNIHPNKIINNQTFLINNGFEIPIEIFGEHNLANINAAKMICIAAGISEHDFYKTISNFKGAAKRLQKLSQNQNDVFFLDFAHSPSKLKATIQAVKKQFPSKKLIACMELHTFSSLNKTFLNEYNGSMNDADLKIVYFNPHTVEHKKLESISINDILESFNSRDLMVFNDSLKMREYLHSIQFNNKVFLMMSSGNFDGIDFKKFSTELIS